MGSPWLDYAAICRGIRVKNHPNPLALFINLDRPRSNNHYEICATKINFRNKHSSHGTATKVKSGFPINLDSFYIQAL